MTDAAIISGSLVDVRNVGTHKSVKLTIHVPEELATKIFAAFGWPTGVNPVSVAIARLNPESEVKQTAARSSGSTTDTPPRQQPSMSAGADKTRRAFADLQPAQQAGILANEEAFGVFLRERHGSSWLKCFYVGDSQEKTAASVIRDLCDVDSRREITRENAKWTSLVLAYRLWQREPEFV